MKSARVKPYVLHAARLERFKAAFDKFSNHFRLTSEAQQKLYLRLTMVTETICREQKMLRYRADYLSESQKQALKRADEHFAKNYLSALKKTSFWKDIPANEKDSARKSLKRNNTSIPISRGRPAYPHFDLALQYAIEIAHLVRQSEKVAKNPEIYRRIFPVSRNSSEYGEDNACPEGPALVLLESSLNLALPFHGAPKRLALEQWVTSAKVQECIKIELDTFS